MHFFSQFFSSSTKHHAHDVYAALVTQARKPVLYMTCGIPDTLDGRFDAILLHLFLLQRRLKELATHEAATLGRHIQEAFISDMDRGLRELGVGDTGVSHRIRKMASALLGRIASYDAAWGDEKAFRDALTRNLYRGNHPTGAQLDALMQQLRQVADCLHSWNSQNIPFTPTHAINNSLAPSEKSAVDAL